MVSPSQTVTRITRKQMFTSWRQPPAPYPPPVSSTWGAADAVLALALTVHLTVALALRHFPYQDVPNHLARYTLIADAWAGHAPAWIDVHLQPTSYVALDLLGALLVGTAGAETAARIFAVLAIVALPLGMYAVLRAVAPAQRGWALVGVLLSFSAYFLSGFLNYVIGIGCALAWLGAWWPHRRTTRLRVRLGLATGLGVLFVIHLSAPLVALFVVGVEGVRATFEARARGARRVLVDILRTRGTTLLACAAGVGVVWSLAALASRGATVPPILNPIPTPRAPTIVFRRPLSKVLALGTPFYSLSVPELAVMVTAYGAALALYLRQQGRGVLRHPLTLASLAFLALYCVWPMTLGSVRALDTRWLLPACLLAFCGPVRPQPALRGPALATLAGLGFAHAAIVWHIGRRIDRDLDAFDRALAHVPPGARVLPLVTAVERYGPRVSPYRHYAMWHLVRTGGRVAGLFAANALYDDGQPYLHLAHVRERARVFYPDEGWGVGGVTPLPWARIRHDFDYLVSAGDADPRVWAEVRPHARPVYRDGDVTVLVITPSGGPASPAPSAPLVAAAAPCAPR